MILESSRQDVEIQTPSSEIFGIHNCMITKHPEASPLGRQKSYGPCASTFQKARPHFQ